MARPTKYTAERCDEVRALGAEGKSRVQIAAALGVARPTLAAWMEAHTAFAAAMQDARDAAQAWWENVGQAAVTGGIKDFAGSAWIFQMKNRFPDDYRDKQEMDLRIAPIEEVLKSLA